ncbi:MAG: GNAT family N-acetyltransferase [Clostridia bacterium]|nr:GNAT family N-acetyltransferase [Clostridia bacterium]
MEFRKTTAAEVEAVAAIYAYAKRAFREAGIPQWQGIYPDAATVRGDIEAGIGYVLVDGAEPVGAVALTTAPEEVYRRITGGTWLTGESEQYMTVHRIAVAEGRRGQGLSKAIMREVEALARSLGLPSIRVDTHEQNANMRGMLASMGYTQCGDIILIDGDEAGDPRLCYEKLL